jgi:DNA-directed RNA polymerase
VAFKHIHQFLSNLEPLAAAAIACKLTIDKVFSFKDGSNQATTIAESIGQAVEDECRMRHYEHEAPGLLNTLKKNYWHKSCGTKQKLVVIRTLMNRYNVKKWEPWSTSVRVKLGAWLLDCIMESSGWFEKMPIRQGRKTIIHVLPTAEFLDIKDAVMSEAELFSPLTWPMLIEPNEWTNEKPGGYILNEVMRGHDLIRKTNPCPIQGELPLGFLNKIQKVGYRLSPFITTVSSHLQETGTSVGKFLPITNYDLPPKPPDIEENFDSRKSYRRERARVENLQKNEFRRSCRTRMTMQAVERFKDVERFYIPWSFDYRGRAYPIPAFLTPQDTDWGKSLIRFADESYMTEQAKEWLSFQVATTYGKDKDTWDERQEWTSKNTPLITRVATDPIDNIGDWEAAEEPWQFLAACDEYYHCVILKDKETTGLPVATDATCSGLQILALLAKDEETARLVNVLPSDRPQDAYKVVAGVAKWNCPSHIQEVMDRKVVKRTVMTIPYNAKPYSNRSYIKDALAEKGIEIGKEDLTITVQAVRDAMNAVVPGPMAVMKWIEDEVSKAIKRGATELEWVTPSGFVVNQRIMKKKVEVIELKLLGRCQLKVATDNTDEVDRNRHKAATAPNLIHSLDATLLHLSVQDFDHPIALIHDSVLCRATDMSELSRIVRQKYMHIAEYDYLNDFAAQIGAETEPPILGGLKPESVIESTYFFC